MWRMADKVKKFKIYQCKEKSYTTLGLGFDLR